MIVVQCLMENIADFKAKTQPIHGDKPCLVQIFTAALLPQAAVALAQEIQAHLPLAQIIGSSVSCVIYNNQQYENQTLIVVEQYEKSTLSTHLWDIHHQDASAITQRMVDAWGDCPPKLLRLFIGAYYDQAHQLMEGINHRLPGMQVAGGMSGELFQSDHIPFVFDATTWVAEGLVCAEISGPALEVYSRINTAQTTISPVYTITQSHNKAIGAIENEPAPSWIQRNLGFSATTQYQTWEEIAENDPLVRFQVTLEGYDRATRFLRYDENQQEISQYFSRLDPGTRFRLSYTSPTKCVEDCRETCQEVQSTPIEHLFCYTCLFRKLYLKHCGQWELTPFHQNPLSGVFLLGEFGYSGGKNQLLNGSCVLSGVTEGNHYLNVDLSRLEDLEGIRSESHRLMDFIIRKQFETRNMENVVLLSNMLNMERSHQPELYRFVDPNLNLYNMLKYEVDEGAMGFDKLCFLKIENADMLMGHMGQARYYDLLNNVLVQFNQHLVLHGRFDAVQVYVAGTDAFVLAEMGLLSEQDFLLLVKDIRNFGRKLQESLSETPILMRFAVISGGSFLLERAYALMEHHRNSQIQILTEEGTPQKKNMPTEDLATIHLIQSAIAHDQVVPYYQGLYNNQAQCIDKYEALMRLFDQNGRPLTPHFFMDVAKRYRLYLDLNLKMFQCVLRDFRGLDSEVSINLSAHDITSPRFLDVMEQELKRFPDPSRLTFEILEDEYFTDMQILRDFIARVRGYGVKIAIDDFGSGYSNLLEIIKIHPDYLKIDGEIIRELHRSTDHEAIVSAMASLGSQLGIQLVAEFVENQEIQTMVEKYHIAYSQGYLFSQPQPFWAVQDEVHTLTVPAPKY